MSCFNIQWCRNPLLLTLCSIIPVHSKLFGHRNKQSHHRALVRSKEKQTSNRNQTRDAAQMELWRVQEPAANVTRRLLGHYVGVLVTALEAAERMQAGGEHDDADGVSSQAKRLP